MIYQILSINVCKKAFAQFWAKALKFMRFLGLFASQVLLFHLPENTFLKKSVAKNGYSKSAESASPHNYRFFGTSKPKVTATRNHKTDLKRFCFSVLMQFDCICLRLS